MLWSELWDIRGKTGRGHFALWGILLGGLIKIGAGVACGDDDAGTMEPLR